MFSVHFDSDNFSRSYYPGSPTPIAENLSFDKCYHSLPEVNFINIMTPINTIEITNSFFSSNRIQFFSNSEVEHGKTIIILRNCTYLTNSPFIMLDNAIKGKELAFNTYNTSYTKSFQGIITGYLENVTIKSDIPTLTR